MFRNVSLLKLAGGWPQSEDLLHEALEGAQFRPCGALSEKSTGWEAPLDALPERLCRSVGGADYLQLRTQSRLLPAAAVNEAVEARLEEFRERTGDLPGRRERRRMKAETRDKLMPKALLRSERTAGIYLRSCDVLCVDAGSPTKLDRFVESLQLGLGRLEYAEMPWRKPVSTLLSSIFLGNPPDGLRIGRECRMQDPSDPRCSVRYADMDLSDSNVRGHIRDGMVLTHLGIEFDGIMSCVIDEKGNLAKLKLAGVEAEDTGAEEDPVAQFDAQFVLFSQTLNKLIETLSRALA